ncbi:sensor histidine kinase [Alterisphingorhabdus coralli]|uniref:histidine kinase n=1 Tax=Alterisphingorhabdus coralli TaxID=3071408 RepID=A0AA97I1E4_9SPHN|nr:sensor histidine kinase [Parasphingorhabdus sp. SCSIO 66989]WOE75977.1 sensor histidine kinase [Parasphingorhabdus sp. SCSIO 66989]
MTQSPESGWVSSDESPTRSTGWKLFVILLVALAPLALIAYLASEQIESSEEATRRDAAASAANLGALRVNSALDSQRAILLRAANLIAMDGDPDLICADLKQELSVDARDRVMIFADGSGEPLCGLNGPEGDIRQAMLSNNSNGVTFLPDHGGLLVAWQGRSAESRAIAFYSNDDLVDIADPAGTMPLVHVELHQDNKSLTLSELPMRNKAHLGDHIKAQPQIAGLDLTVRLPRERKSSSQYLIRIIPFMMILAAAVIGWLVVTRMLVRPIRHLRNKMRSFAPGSEVTPMRSESMIAHEILELDDVFSRLATKVRTDKQALADGLDEQVKLTREVHHRVKNNLQIVASLLSLHARGAQNDEIARIYASIQRRVNALGVVHRHHFADTEASHGIALRDLICEVVTSFRAHSSKDNLDARTSLKVEPAQVDQDVAMPIAFLLTEILELIQNSDADGDITITVNSEGADDGFAHLTIASPTLGENPMLDAMLEGGVAKILQGLSRQLRARLEQDRETGRFSLPIRLFGTPATERHSDISASVAAARAGQSADK